MPRAGNPTPVESRTRSLHLILARSFPVSNCTNLFSIAEWQDEIPWQPFREGLEIHRLYGDGVSGPTAALLRFSKAGKVPLHEHGGYEHILVLAGSQRDQNSDAAAGTLMINPPGTRASRDQRSRAASCWRSTRSRCGSSRKRSS